MVGCNIYVICYLMHRKHCFTAKNFGQQALVNRRQVLYQDVGHTGIWRDAAQKFAECAKAARRCANSHYGKVYGMMSG